MFAHGECRAPPNRQAGHPFYRNLGWWIWSQTTTIRKAYLVDIRIGITNSPRELSFETNESPAEIEQTVSQALTSGSGHLSLKDNKGKLYLVPVAGVAYIEIGTEESRRIGFVG